MASRDDHPLAQYCQDEDCPRFLCRLYKQGRCDGYDGNHSGLAGFNGMAVGYGHAGITAPNGWPDGYEEGFAAGFAAGYSAGAASAA